MLLIYFYFPEALALFSIRLPSRFSLYLLWRNPPQQDGAAIGARKLNLDFHNAIFIEMLKQVQHDNYASSPPRNDMIVAHF